MDPIALLIIHSDRIVRESLCVALMQRDELVVVNTLDGDGSTAAADALRERRADVVLLDIAVAQRYGSELIRELKRAWPDVKVLVMGIADRDGDILATFELGAAGYATQNSSIRELVANIQALMIGQTICSARIASVLFAHVSNRAHTVIRTRAGSSSASPRLTRREAQIVALIEAGLTNKEIGRQLSLEVRTVKNHVHNILEKLQVRGRIDAVRYAKAHGLLSPGDIPVRVSNDDDLGPFHGAIRIADKVGLKN